MSGVLQVFNPYDRGLFTTLEAVAEAEAFAALERAYALYRDRSRHIRPHERIAVLERAAGLMRERREELIREAVMEGGKPWADSVVEVDRAINGFAVAVQELATGHGEEVPMTATPAAAGRLAMTMREPRGVVMAISAFNHPVNLIVHQVVPAFAAGCPALVKPASATPVSCRNVVRILHEAGVPEEWVQFLPCSGAVAEKLVADERVAFLSFIGSARVGWMLRSRLAPGATCALEHGGAAPVIVDATADLDAHVPALVKGGFYHAGQVCVSVQRIYAHASIAGELARKMATAAERLVVGNPLDPRTEVGPLINPGEVERVEAWVNEAREAGAQVLCGGERFSDTCYKPTVLFNPSDDVQVSQQEIFGPVVCVYSYTDRDEAIARANALPYAFQASVIAQDIDAALYAVRRLDAMAVMVNDHTAFRVDWMPFGGYRRSGMGVGGIAHSMREMSVEKLMVIKSPSL